MSAYTLDYTYTAPSALIDGADSRALSLATSGGGGPPPPTRTSSPGSSNEQTSTPPHY